MLIDHFYQQETNNLTADSSAGKLAVSVKRGNKNRVKSVYRDAQFFSEFWKLRRGADSQLSLGTSVTIPAPFKRFLSQYPPIANHTYHRPAHWREVSPWLKAFYWHEAMIELGPVHAFTLNLNDQIEGKARTAESAARFLHKRIAHHLKAAFPDSAPTFWFALERTDNLHDRLHLHGEVVSLDGKKVRQALRLAAGEWESVRQHQAHLSPSPDIGWIGYTQKHHIWNKRAGKGRTSKLLASLRGFDGSATARTLNVNRMAQELYERDRSLVSGVSG